MTVAELIAALAACDQDARVIFDDDGYDKPSWVAFYPEIHSVRREPDEHGRASVVLSEDEP